MPSSKFANALKALREKEELTQAEAAESWGVNLRTLQEWEYGRTTPPDFLAKCVLFYLRFRNSVKGK